MKLFLNKKHSRKLQKKFIILFFHDYKSDIEIPKTLKYETIQNHIPQKPS